MLTYLKNHKFAAAGMLLLICAVGFYFGIKRRGSSEVVGLRSGPIVESVYGLGKVKSRRRYDVKLGVTATVTRLNVDEGDIVTSGQALIGFDTLSVFRAPFAGVVTLINAYENETVPPQTTVLRLEDLNDRYIEVSLEQEAALRVRPNQSVRVAFESLRNQNYTGVVDSIFPKNDEFLAHIKVDKLDTSILPGMTADTSIEIGKIDKALLIPVSALRNGMVIVDRDGKQQKLKVEIGHVDGLWAEVKGGDLSESDRVVVPKAKP